MHIKAKQKLLLIIIPTFFLFFSLFIFPIFFRFPTTGDFTKIIVNYVAIQFYFLVPVILKIKNYRDSIIKLPLLIMIASIMLYIFIPDKDDIMYALYVIFIFSGYVILNICYIKEKLILFGAYVFLYLLILLLIFTDKYLLKGCGRMLDIVGINVYPRESDPYSVMGGFNLDFFPAYIDALIFCASLSFLQLIVSKIMKISKVIYIKISGKSKST